MVVALPFVGGCGLPGDPPPGTVGRVLIRGDMIGAGRLFGFIVLLLLLFEL